MADPKSRQLRTLFADLLIDVSRDALIALSLEGHILSWNRGAEAIFGYTAEEAVGQLIEELVVPREQRVAAGKTLAEVLERGTILFETVRRRKDGSLIHVDVTMRLVSSPLVEPFIAVSKKDVTELRRLQAQQQEATRSKAESKDQVHGLDPAPDAMVILGHDGRMLLVNAQTERPCGSAAEREHERARLKSEISLLLVDVTQAAEPTPTLTRVVDLIARSLATWCVVHLADNQRARLITAHADPAKVAWAEELAKHWSPDPNGPHGIDAVIRTGQPDWMSDVPDDVLVQVAHGPEHLALLRKIGMTSYVCVPLRVRQRVIGALTFVSSEADRRYDEADVTFAQQVADLIALALDNARLYREAQDAKTAAERLYSAEQKARSEAESLLRIAGTLSEAQLDLETLVQRVTDEATRLVGAKFGALFHNVVGDDGEAYMLYTLSGAPREAFERMGLPRKTPIFAPTFAGQGITRLDDVRRDPRYGQMAPHHGMPRGHLPVTSYLAVPVISRTGFVIGGLFFGHPEPGQFTEQHERMANALAAHAAAAIDNARLFKETREAEERQARLVGELERAVRFSEMFIGILGHDLRNPLSGITTAASLILSRADSDRVAKPVSRILSSADRISRMIDQILDFTRVRLGRGIPLKRKTMDLAEVCRLVLDELKSEDDNGTDARLEIRGEAVGTWDEDRLAQMISNLAGNALHHRERGTQVVVSIDGSQADRVTMTIDNKGTIPPELLPLIFEPLHGGEPRKREGSSGLGLGLYITQQILVAHGGAIRVRSGGADGQTRFTVELPRTPPAGSAQVFGSNGGRESS